MRTLDVVVHTVLTKDSLQVLLVHDQHPVQTLPPTAADPSLGVGVRSGRHERSQDHTRSLRSDHGVCRRRELLVPVVDDGAELDAFILKRPAQVPELAG